jgi:hypothetical protein
MVSKEKLQHDSIDASRHLTDWLCDRKCFTAQVISGKGGRSLGLEQR